MGVQLVEPVRELAMALASSPAARALVAATLLAAMQLAATLAIAWLLGFVVELPPAIGALGGLAAGALPLALFWAAQGAGPGAASGPTAGDEPGAGALSVALGLVRFGGAAGCAAAGALGTWLNRPRPRA
jgi:hypothetical protein